MEMTEILKIAGGLAVGLLGKIVWDWLKNGRGKKVIIKDSGASAEIKATLEEQRLLLAQLSSVLGKCDESGTPLCYMPREWKQLLASSVERGGQTNELLRHMTDEIRDQRNLIIDILRNR